MKIQNSRSLRVLLIATVIVVSIALFSTSGLASTLRIGQIQSYDEVTFRVVAGLGYFTPARGMMRDLYGDALNLHYGLDGRVSGKVLLGIHGGYIEQNKDNKLYLKYRNIQIAPTITYLLNQSTRHTIYTQLAGGLNFRKVYALRFVATQKDFGFSTSVGIGADYLIKSPVFIGGKVMFDYIFDSDPTLGALGNTGGINLTLVAGVVL